MSDRIVWRREPSGYFAMYRGNRLSVQRVRRKDGKGFSYFPRVNDRATEEVPRPYATLPAAKRAARNHLDALFARAYQGGSAAKQLDAAGAAEEG